MQLNYFFIVLILKTQCIDIPKRFQQAQAQTPGKELEIPEKQLDDYEKARWVYFKSNKEGV